MKTVLSNYLLHFCEGLHLDSRFINWRLLECSWAPLSFFLFGLWSTYHVLVFDCLMQLLSYVLWMKTMFNGFLIGKENSNLQVMKSYLIHDFYFVNVVETFMILY